MFLFSLTYDYILLFKFEFLPKKVEILDESTGQIILKEQIRNIDSIVLTEDLDDVGEEEEEEEDDDNVDVDELDNQFRSKNSQPIILNTNTLTNQSNDFNMLSQSTSNRLHHQQQSSHNHLQPHHQIIIIESNSNVSSSVRTHQIHKTSNRAHSNMNSNANMLNSNLSPHIIQNYSILAQEITSPLDNSKLFNNHNDSNKLVVLNESSPSSSQSIRNSLIKNDEIAYDDNNQHKSSNQATSSRSSNSSNGSTSTNSNKVNNSRAQKDIATCQFCGRAMLKKNIPTHIRRAHTPKEELVCLNEEQNIFTFHHLKPGQRRKRSARAYDYSLMTATVSIDEDPCEGIENKFITEGEEILSTDLIQLADRIKYGISQIPTSTLTKLIDILAKIEYSTQDEISANAKNIRNMIYFYLTSNEEFKYKIRLIGDDINEKKKQVNSLRADLKEVMTRKAQLERRIQPLVCELQKLEDHHGNLIESILNNENSNDNDLLNQYEIIQDSCNSVTDN